MSAISKKLTLKTFYLTTECNARVKVLIIQQLKKIYQQLCLKFVLDEFFNSFLTRSRSPLFFSGAGANTFYFPEPEPINI